MKQNIGDCNLTNNRSSRRRFSIALLALVSSALFAQAQPAQSKRSLAAIERVTPELHQALAQKNLALGNPVFLRIFKREKILEAWVRGNDSRFLLFREYPICTFSGTLGPKMRQGDRQAPEGFYRVTAQQMNPYSRYHLSFDLGYPNAYDRAHQRTGSALMVHGRCVSIGCYAMGDDNIEQIYALLDAAFRQGQKAVKVHAFPFRLTDAALAQQKNNPWHAFWRQLKNGYDVFEQTHIPPDIIVRQKEYVVR